MDDEFKMRPMRAEPLFALPPPAGRRCVTSRPLAHGTSELWVNLPLDGTRRSSAGLACCRRVCFFTGASGELRSQAGEYSPRLARVRNWNPAPAAPAAAKSSSMVCGVRFGEIERRSETTLSGTVVIETNGSRVVL